MIKQKTQEELREEAREDIYRRVRAFEDRTNTHRKKQYGDGNFTPVTKVALGNYALSLLNVEYYKLPVEDRETVLNQYL